MSPKAKHPTWRTMGLVGDDQWSVNLGPRSPFVTDPSEAPPQTLADRYTATVEGEPWAIKAITVTDRVTGASIRLPASDVPQATIDDLWRAAGEIFGIARGQVGRPSEREARIAAYTTLIRSFRDSGWDETRILAATILKRLNRTGDDSQLGEDVKPYGGWRSFRAKVYRSE